MSRAHRVFWRLAPVCATLDVQPEDVGRAFVAIHLELRVENLLIAAGLQFSRPLRGGRGLDYLVKSDALGRVAIEVKNYCPRASTLRGVVSLGALFSDMLDTFLLVTPEPPTGEQRGHFSGQLEAQGVEGDWIGVSTLPERLGLEGDIDLTSAEDSERLEAAVVARKVAAPSRKDPGLHKTPPSLRDILSNPDRTRRDRESLHRGLRQKLPPHIFERVLHDPRPLQDILVIGDRVRSATVVISDIKSFTKLVRLAQPDDLRRCMGEYYKRARQRIWEHGGVLDKFIGDGVLAIFGYPYPREDAAKRAIQYCREIIELGREVLSELSSAMVERVVVPTDGRAAPPSAAPEGDRRIIQTGTRVGVASGPVWVLDIGFDTVEPSFIGDAMNRAARLEGMAAVNGALIDQVTRHELSKIDMDFVDELQLTPGPCEFKGIDYDIETWEVRPATLAKLTGASLRQRR